MLRHQGEAEHPAAVLLDLPLDGGLVVHELPGELPGDLQGLFVVFHEADAPEHHHTPEIQVLRQ